MRKIIELRAEFIEYIRSEIIEDTRAEFNGGGKRNLKLQPPFFSSHLQ